MTADQSTEEVRVGDRIIITDANINFGQFVGVSATVVGVGDYGVWVVGDSGTPGRHEIEVDGRMVPTRTWIESYERQPAYLPMEA